MLNQFIIRPIIRHAKYKFKWIIAFILGFIAGSIVNSTFDITQLASALGIDTITCKYARYDTVIIPCFGGGTVRDGAGAGGSW